jgi:hypothetical protein
MRLDVLVESKLVFFVIKDCIHITELEQLRVLRWHKLSSVLLVER